MRLLTWSLSTCLFLLPTLSPAQKNDPHLLLTPRRLHRLKLDHDRQTDRWNNFEQRVRTVTDSPERGFELGLYYAIARSEQAGRAAIEWALAHPSEIRQRQLVADWCAPLLSAVQHDTLSAASGTLTGATDPIRTARESLFQSVLRGQKPPGDFRTAWTGALRMLQQDPASMQPDQLYGLFEIIDAMQTNYRVDLRRDDADLFSKLPEIFLLELSPEQLEHPAWKTRMAGLMMVSVDPNLQASSFVQGWAMEDPKQQKDGPGVGYELLWANPYLPGLGYYNMDPWVYQPNTGFLIARMAWEPDACWIKQTPRGFESQRCPANVQTATAAFGKLTVRPLEGRCLTVKHDLNRTVILSGLKPGAVLTWQSAEAKRSGTADPSGLFLLPFDAYGKVCLEK